MAFKRKSGGSMVDVTTVKRRSGGAWVNVSTVKRRVSGAWVVVFPSFSASADPNPAYGFAPAGGGAPATTGATITVTGGVGPFTHNGTFISGGAGITIGSPTTAAPTWSTANDSAQLRTGTYRHTVTDTGAGSATTSVDIPVTLEVA